LILFSTKATHSILTNPTPPSTRWWAGNPMAQWCPNGHGAPRGETLLRLRHVFRDSMHGYVNRPSKCPSKNRYCMCCIRYDHIYIYNLYMFEYSYPFCWLLRGSRL
jgi:hypothetical protein